MKLKKCILFALATLGLMACSNEDENGPSIDSNSPKSIFVSIQGASLDTKAAPSTPGAIVGDGTAGTINAVDLYITDASGVILRALTAASGSADWTSLTTTGLKVINVEASANTVYVFGNLGGTLAGEGANISTVDLTKTLAQQQGTTSLLYQGMDNNLTPIVPEPTPPSETVGSTYTATVELTPIVSRFQITRLEFMAAGTETVSKVEGGVTKTSDVAWTGFTGDVIGIYMDEFYFSNLNRTPSIFKINTTSVGTIQNGQWLFDSGANDYAEIASYSNYAAPAYIALPLPQTTSQCYPFNFFPENLSAVTIPKIYFQVTNMRKTTLTSTDHNVFNPALVAQTPTTVQFVNVISYRKSDSTPMTEADFQANKLYNLEISIKPYYLQDDINHVQYNVLCTVTVKPWTVQNLLPDFEGL